MPNLTDFTHDNDSMLGYLHDQLFALNAFIDNCITDGAIHETIRFQLDALEEEIHAALVARGLDPDARKVELWISDHTIDRPETLLDIDPDEADTQEYAGVPFAAYDENTLEDREEHLPPPGAARLGIQWEDAVNLIDFDAPPADDDDSEAAAS